MRKAKKKSTKKPKRKVKPRVDVISITWKPSGEVTIGDPLETATSGNWTASVSRELPARKRARRKKK
jgi:hypothetical protein